MPQLKQRSVRGGSVTLFAQGIKFLLTLGSTAVLARLLTPSDFGLVAMIAAVTGFLSLLRDLGLSMVTVQRASISQEAVSALFWINMALSTSVAIIVVLIAPLVARFYGDARLAPIMVVFAAFIALGGLAIQHQALLERQMRLGTLAAIEISSQFVGVFTSIVLALQGAGYWALVSLTAAQVAANVILIWSCSSWRPHRPRSSPEIRSMIAFGGYLTGFNFVNYGSRNLDNVLIGWRWGPGPLGLYSRAYQLLLLPINQINRPISRAAIPMLSRLQDDPVRYRRAYLQMLETLALLTMPSIAILIAASRWIIELVLGPQWTAAADIFVWLGIAGLIQPIASTVGWLFISQDRTKTMFLWGVAGSTISIGSFLVGLPHGPVGVAASYAIGYVVIQTPVLFHIVSRRGPIRHADFYRCIWFPLTLSIVLLTAILLVQSFFRIESSLVGLAAVTLTVAAVVGVVLLTPPGRYRGKQIVALLELLRRPKTSN